MTRLIPIFVVLLWIGASGCYTRTAHDNSFPDLDRAVELQADWGEEFAARVSRVEGPYVVHADGSFELGVFDGLGCPNRFVRFEVAWQDDEATIVVIGVRPPEPVACPQNAPRAKPRLLEITPPPYERVEIIFNAGTGYEIRMDVNI